jgi:steroid delta-isomerase
MTTKFSFSSLLRHIGESTSLPRLASSPTEAHMREVMEAYVANIGKGDSGFEEKYLAESCTGADPVGSEPLDNRGAPETMAQAVSRLIDISFIPQKAELISPVSFSLENKAAMAFKFWAEVGGRNITIDIIDVMTFDALGKICDIRAYWGFENVTVLD